MDIVDISSSDEIHLNSDKVKFLLQSEEKKYFVIKNQSSTALSSWWKTFGFPAQLNENNQYQQIPGYVSCFNCFQTFIYSRKSGTTRLNEHAAKCVKSTIMSSSTSIDQSNDPSSSQSILDKHGFKKPFKFNEKDVDNIKQLCAQWVCQDLRPFSTIEDSGFRTLAQEFIRIDMLPYFSSVRSNKFFVLLFRS
jgi:hypothetical protein